MSGGDSDQFSHNVRTGTLASYTFNVNTQAVAGALTWNRNGTLKQLQISEALNASNSQTYNYTYDDLARIATANCGSSIWNQTFTTYGASYDLFGNVKKDVPPGSTRVKFLPTYSATTNRFTAIPGGVRDLRC